MDWPAIITALVGAGGLGAAAMHVVKYLLARRKQDSAATAAERRQTREDRDQTIARLEKRVTQLEEAHQKCLQENAQLQREVGALREAVYRLEGMRHVALIVADEAGKIVDWSTGGTDLFGWTREEAIGKDITLLTPVRFRGRHLAGFRRATKERRIPDRKEPLEAFAVNRHGQEIPVAIVLSGWEDSGKLFYSAEIRRRY